MMYLNEQASTGSFRDSIRNGLGTSQYQTGRTFFVISDRPPSSLISRLSVSNKVETPALQRKNAKKFPSQRSSNLLRYGENSTDTPESMGLRNATGNTSIREGEQEVPAPSTGSTMPHSPTGALSEPQSAHAFDVRMYYNSCIPASATSEERTPNEASAGRVQIIHTRGRDGRKFESLPSHQAGEPAAPMGVTLQEALQTLEEIASFPAAWDGYDALEVPIGVTDRATAIVKQLVAVPFVSATPAGTVQFEFEDDYGYLELEIDEGKPVRMAQRLGQDDGCWRKLQLRDDEVPGIVQAFYEQRL